MFLRGSRSCVWVFDESFACTPCRGRPSSTFSFIRTVQEHDLVRSMRGISALVAIAVKTGIPNSPTHFKLREATVGGQGAQTALWIEAAGCCQINPS